MVALRMADADGAGQEHFILVQPAVQFSVAAYRVATIGHVASVNDLSVTFGDLVMLQKASERAEETRRSHAPADRACP